jgi:hypothetical protein
MSDPKVGALKSLVDDVRKTVVDLVTDRLRKAADQDVFDVEGGSAQRMREAIQVWGQARSALHNLLDLCDVLAGGPVMMESVDYFPEREVLEDAGLLVDASVPTDPTIEALQDLASGALDGLEAQNKERAESSSRSARLDAISMLLHHGKISEAMRKKLSEELLKIALPEDQC